VVRLVLNRAPSGVPPSPFEEQAGTAGRRTAPSQKSSETTAANTPLSFPIGVSVTATEECWMRVWTDNGDAQDYVLKSGVGRFLQGMTRIQVLVDNAAVVRMSGPRGPVGLPAAPGKVVNIIFTREGEPRLRIVEASSTPVSSTASSP